MKRALLVLMLRGTIPTNTEEAKLVWSELDDIISWKIGAKMDEIEESRKRQKENIKKRAEEN